MKNKKIGLLGAISIGIGGMIGGGIFAVLGEAVSFAHGATVVAFLIAGIVALFTAYSYAKFSVNFQNRGGTVFFIDKAFGHNLISGSLNLLLWISYLVTISLYSIAFSSYAQTFFDEKSFLVEHFLISIAIIIPTVINFTSTSFVSKSEVIIVIIKLVLLVFIIVTGLFYVDISRFSSENWGEPFSIFVAGMVIFVAYEGFELISNSSEDIENPNKNLPRAFYIAVLCVLILYILIAVITVGAIPLDKLLYSKDYALAVTAEPALGKAGFIIVTITALLATFSAINATIYGNARLSYSLAKDGELPKKIEQEKNGIPFAGIGITTAISLVLANSIDLTQIAIIGSASFLLVFSIVNIGALKMYKEIGANRWILIFASCISSISLFLLLFHTYEKSINSLIIFFTFICFSIFFEYIYGKYIRGHFLKRSY